VIDKNIICRWMIEYIVGASVVATIEGDWGSLLFPSATEHLDDFLQAGRAWHLRLRFPCNGSKVDAAWAFEFSTGFIWYMKGD
jgi:hypothetical protein